MDWLGYSRHKDKTIVFIGIFDHLWITKNAFMVYFFCVSRPYSFFFGIPFLPQQPCKVFSHWLIFIYPRVYRLQQSQSGGCRTIRVRKCLQLGTIQGDREKVYSLFVWLTIMMQVTIHQIANQRWTLIWIWRVILISRFGSIQCYAIYMNNHIFFRQFNRHVLHSR